MAPAPVNRVCPERAIKFVKRTPQETGGSQYDVDLRTGTSWPSMMTYAVGATGNPGSEGSSAANKGAENKWQMDCGQDLDLAPRQKTYETVPTSKYEEWIGGHGMAAALFWDYCEDKTITDPADPKRTCAFWQRPYCGHASPSGGGRAEMVAVGTQGYPTPLVYALEHGWTFPDR